jgi:Tol biopolymer transport system component
MTDLHARFKSFDLVRAPDLWDEIQERATVANAPAGVRRFTTSNHFAPVALVGGVVVLILIGVGLLVRPLNVGPELPVPSASPGASNSEPSSSSVGGAIAYVAESGPSTLHLVVPGEEPTQLAPGRVAASEAACPAFSPDGNTLAFGVSGGSIMVVPISDDGEAGSGTRLSTLAGERTHCAAWSPDSSAVAFLDDSALWIAPLTGDAQRIGGWDIHLGGSFEIDYPADRAVQWSPDGAVIAVARPSGTWLIPSDGGTPRRLDDTPTYSVSWSPDGRRLVAGAGGTTAVVLRIADGSMLAEIPMGFRPPAWSPVDDRIALSDADARVIVVDPDGTDSVVIDDYGYNVTWSPDGAQLLYVQDAGSTAWRLLSADADGSGTPTVIVDAVAISTARSFPAAEQITWQPVQP